MNIKQRFLSALLALVLVLSSVPTTAIAEALESANAAPVAEAVQAPEDTAAAEEPAAPAATEAAPAAEATAPAAAPGDASADAAAEPQAAPAMRVEKDAAPAAEEDTSRVKVTVGTLTDGGIVPGQTEFANNETISDVVNLDVSGKDYTLSNPYLQIRIPRTNKVKDFTIVDSQAGTTTRTEDDNYTYVIYRFPSVSGGANSTYPYSFSFDGSYAKPGDTVTVDATLYTSDGVEVAKDQKTYSTTAYDLVPWSQVSMWSPVGETPNGHRYTRQLTVPGGNTSVIPDGYSYTDMLYLSIAPNNGGSTSKGLAVPDNYKVVVTLPANVKILDPSVYSTVENLPDGRQRITYLRNNPTFVPRSESSVGTNRFAAFANMSNASSTSSSVSDGLRFVVGPGAPFNTELPISIDYYINANTDGTGGTSLGNRVETFTIAPREFVQTGKILVEKEGYIPYTYGGVGASGGYEYTYIDGKLYAGRYEVTNSGLGFRTMVRNTNNGTSQEKPYEGGKVSKISEVVTTNDDPNLRYSSFRLPATVSTYGTPSAAQKPFTDAAIAAANKAINEGNTKLYGIRSDGTEVLIREHVQLGETIPITESREREFVSLALRFESPITLDNTLLYAYDYSKLISTEDARLKAQPVTAAATTYRTSMQAKTDTGTAYSYGPNSSYSYVRIKPLYLTVDEQQPGNASVVYRNGGVSFSINVGPEVSSGAGPVTTIANMKTITLLPDGVEFDGLGTQNKSNSSLDTPKVTTVENFRGTGKTAVIVDYGNLPDGQYSRIYLSLRANAGTARGANEIPTYLVWDSNDTVPPKSNPYTDALDLDGDGDTAEVYQLKTSTLTFTPPLELMLTKRAMASGVTAARVTGDRGSALSYQLSIYNNAINAVSSLTVLDVLPYAGDHTIVPNTAGDYTGRGTTFVTGLTGSLEAANTAEINEKFSFSYQLTAQGATLESVRDGAWLTAAQVKDFSQVKSIRAILKSGQTIPSRTEVVIVIPSRFPTDTSLKGSLDPTPDRAVNTAAYSTDGRTFTEANSTTAYVANYEIKGTYFADVDGDATFTQGKDTPLAGRTLQIVDASGNPAKDPSGKVIPPVVTAADGTYAATVYAGGTYRMVATKQGTEDFVATLGTGVQGNTVEAASVQGNTGRTTAAELSSSSMSQIRNVGVVLVPGTVNVTKTSKAEDGRAAGPLAGAVFRITAPDGSRVIGTDGVEVADATTDAQGKASFAKVPLGTYQVSEVSAPTGYALDTAKKSVTLTRAATTATVTAENALNRTAVKVSKVWNDAENQDGARPASVTVRLLADGAAAGKTVTLSAANSWTASFTGLRTHTDAGKAIAYTVSEDAVAGYTAVVTGTAEAGYTVTNTHPVEKRDVAVSGSFSDANNQDGIRPTSLVVRLLADGQPTGKTVTLNAANNWKASFTGLDKNAAGKEIVYTVAQDAVTDYTVTYGGNMTAGLTVLDAHTPAKCDISAAKVWSDANNQDGIRPASVTVHLAADGRDTGKTVTLNAANGWKASFTGLDVNRDEGTEIRYTVSEDAVAGYTAAVTGTAASGYTVTNTHPVEKRDVKVSASFSDADNQDGIRPESVTVRLLADGKDTGKTVALNGANKWTADFTDLDKNAAGKEIAYTIVQDGVEGYTLSYGGNMTGGLSVLDTHIPAVVTVPVTKAWVDDNNAKDLRPASVTVRLSADGTPVAGKAIELTAAGSWKGSFANLPKFKAGKEIAYTVKEDAVDNYESVVSGTAATGYTVTNTIVGKVSVAATKAWSGIVPEAAPEVTVNLIANGTKVDSQVLNGGNGWQHTFADLDQYEGGREIRYTIEEEGANGGKLAAGGHDYNVKVAGKDLSYTVTNELVNPKIAVSGTVSWIDADNQDGIRPDTAEIRLVRNGEPTNTVIPVDATGDGSFSFTGLPTFDDHGRPITYTVAETAIDEYETEITGDAENGFAVVNTHEVYKRDIAVNKVWEDADNQDGIRPEDVTVHLIADGEDTGQSLTLNEEGEWAGSFTDLDVNRAGKEIDYTLEEDAVDEYETSYTGTMEDGLTVTNTHEVYKRDIPVEKVWEDADDQDGIRPESILVKLIANGEPTDVTLALNAEDDWKATFEQLDVNAAGEEIDYTVEEEPVEGYEASYKGDMVEGFTVTNTHEVAKRSIDVTKVWDDANDKDGIRPGSITVKLLADGKETGETLELKASDDWKASFVDLDVNAAGEEIVYTVSENAVDGYEASYTGDMAEGLTVTNSHEPKPSKRALPKTGDILAPGALALAGVLGLAALADGLRRRRGTDA